APFSESHLALGRLRVDGDCRPVRKGKEGGGREDKSDHAPPGEPSAEIFARGFRTGGVCHGTGRLWRLRDGGCPLSGGAANRFSQSTAPCRGPAATKLQCERTRSRNQRL